MVVYDLNELISDYNYSELFMTGEYLDKALKLAHNSRCKAKIDRDILRYDKCNDDIDTILINKDTIKNALMIKERESIEIFKNRLIGIHYLN